MRFQDCVRAWAGLALGSRRKGQIYSAPKFERKQITENDGVTVSKLVHELEFGIVICFGSEG